MANPDSEPPLLRPPDEIIDPNAARKLSLYDRIGGRPIVEEIIDRLYTAIETDPVLRSLFPEDLAPGRLHQQWYLEEWLGGEHRYTARRGSPRLGQRHQPFAITHQAAARWLGHMQTALDDAGVETTDLQSIMKGLQPLATHFVNAERSNLNRNARTP